MHLTINRKELLNALKVIKGSACNVKLRPAHGCVHLDATRERLMIEGARDSHGMSIALDPCEIEQHGKSALKLKDALDILQAMSDELVTLKSSQDKEIEFSQESFDFRHCATVPPSEDVASTLRLLAMSGELIATIDASILHKLISSTSHCIGRDDLRKNMMCLQLLFSNGAIEANATDGHRLAHYSIDVEHDITPGTELLLPRASALELARVCKRASSCRLTISATHMSAQVDDTLIVIELAQDKFFDIEFALKQISDCFTLPINTANLLSACALVTSGALRRSKTHHVRLSASAGDVVTVHSSKEEEAASRAVIPSSCAERKISIRLNHHYLKQAIRALKSEEIHMHLLDTLSPAFITPAEQPEGEDMRMIIMPMRM